MQAVNYYIVIEKIKDVSQIEHKIKGFDTEDTQLEELSDDILFAIFYGIYWIFGNLF